MTLTKGQRLVLTKRSRMFVGTIFAIFEDYYLVRDVNRKVVEVFEDEYVTYEEYYS